MAAAARQGQQQQQEEEDQPWYEQGIGVLLNNPVTRTAMVPLDLLDKPRRAAVYGYSEAQRMLPDWAQQISPVSEERAAEANEQGFFEALSDPSYGFGDVSKQVGGDSEWAKWANRGIGLAGDVALDPFTYVTAGAGTGTRFAGPAGRASLAGRASRLGLADEVVQRAARLGPHGLSADELAKLGIRGKGLADIAPDASRVAADLGKEAPRQGVRFMGQRLPGTERIARPFTRTVAETRGAINRAPGMSRVRRLRSPEGLEDAFEKLATGRDPRAGPMSATMAAELVDWDNARRMAAGSFKSTFVQRARPWVQDMRGGDPQRAVRMAEQGEGELARILEEAAEEADRYGVQVWHHTSGVGTKGFVPHVWTPDARRWFAKTDDFGKELRKQFGVTIDELGEESGVMLRRKFKARFDDRGNPIPYEVKGREVIILDDTIDGINKAFAQAFPEAPKILDDNATSIMSNYLGRLGQDVGTLAGAKRLLESKAGLVLSADDKRALREIADEDKTRVANRAAATEHRLLKLSLDDSATKIRNEAVDKVTRARGAITPAIREALDDIPTSAKMKAQINKLLKQGTVLEADRAGVIKAFDDEIAEFGQNLYDVEQQVRAAERAGLDALEIAEQTKAGARGQLAKDRAKERRRLLRELKANAAELEADRATLTAIRDRMAGITAEAEMPVRKAEILERGLAGPGSEEFIARYGGENVRLPRGPDVRPGPGGPIPGPGGSELPPLPASATLERDRELAKAYEAADAKVREADTELAEATHRLGVLEAPSGRPGPPPPEVQRAIEAAEEARDLALQARTWAYEDRGKIAKAAGFTEPIYNVEGREMTKTEFDTLLADRYAREEARLTALRDAPPPTRPQAVADSELREAEQQMAELTERAAMLDVPPSGVSLPTLRKRLRTAEAAEKRFRDAGRAGRAIDQAAFAEAQQVVRRTRAEIANITEKIVPDPATYRAQLTKLTKANDAAQAEKAKALAAEGVANRKFLEGGKFDTKAKQRVDDATKAARATERELEKFQKTIAPKRGAIQSALKHYTDLAKKLRARREAWATFAERRAAHDAQVTQARRQLDALPAWLTREERKGVESISGYRRPLMPPRTPRLHEQRLRELEEIWRSTTASAEDRAAAKVEWERLQRPEEFAHTRVRLATPTELGEIKGDIAPEWTPPRAASDPIKVAIETPQATSGGSPELVTRHGRVTDDLGRARVTSSELSRQGRAPTPEWDARLVDLQARADKALVNYETFPAVGTAETLEGALADSRRYADFTLRYAEAVRAGAPPGRDLSSHVLQSVVEAERNVVRADLNDVKRGKGVVDYEVEKTVDLFRNLIEDLDDASNAEAWARKLTAIQELEPGERIVHLRNRIAINEEWQAHRKSRLTRMRARQRYAATHPESVGLQRTTPSLEFQSAAPHREVVETYQREHSGVERILSPIRRERPKKRRYTYSRAQFREARRRLTEIEGAKAKAELRKVTRTEDIADLRVKLRSGEVTITELLESKDPVVMNADVEQILTAVPGVGRVRARHILENAGVRMRFRSVKGGAAASAEALARTPVENRELIARYRAEASQARRHARQVRAYEGFLADLAAHKRRVRAPGPAPERTVTAAQATDAATALKEVRGTTAQTLREQGLEGPEYVAEATRTPFTSPGKLKKIKMSALGPTQRANIATQLRVPQPEPYRRTARVQRRFDLSEGRARKLHYDVEELENEISGADQALRSMKEELSRTEEGGITSDVLAVKKLFEIPERRFDEVTGQVIETPVEPLSNESLQLLHRVLTPETAESLRTAWDQAAIETPESYASAAEAALDFLQQIYDADSDELYEAMMDVAESPEMMRTALQRGAIDAAQANTSAAIQNLEDSFRTLGLRFGDEEGGLYQVLGYNRGQGTLNVEKLRDTVTKRVNRDREVFENARLRRIATLTRRELRLDTASKALGKKPTQTTVAMLRAGDKKAGEVLEGWMYTAEGNLRKFNEKDLAEGRLPEVIADVEGRKVKGIKPLLRDNPKAVIRNMRVATLGEATPPIGVVREGGRALPRADWEHVIDSLARQTNVRPTRGVAPTPGRLALAGGRPTGALFTGSPAAQRRAVDIAQQRYGGAKTAATGRLGELQTQLADIAERWSASETDLATTEAALAQREAQGATLQAQLEQASGSVTRDWDQITARIQTQLDDERNYTIRAIDQFGDWKDAKTDQTSRIVAQIDEQLAQTREAIAHAETRAPMLDMQRAQLGADAKTLKRKVPKGAVELHRYLGEVRTVASQRLDDGSPEMVMVETLLQEAADKMGVLYMHDLAAPQLDRMIKAADEGTLISVTRHVLDDHWKHLAENLLPAGQAGIVARNDLDSAMRHVAEKANTGELAKMIEFYTDFFKTYAVMSPGFQIRNAISGAFMNATEGVGLRHTTEAGKLWREYRKDPIEFAQTHGIGTPEADRIGKAFEATLGSGAGGQFAERGVGPTITRSSRLFNNPLTRASKWGGEWVEGPVRLALGLDSIDRGYSNLDALNRITRLHFDYGQVSKMDRQAKRLVPFWTFMSRNLPLQVTQMWMKPKVYLWYQSMVRNLSEPNHPYTPGYWLEQGAFTMGGSIGGDDLYLAPDLPHTRVQQDIANLADPARLLSNINPLARVPLETAVAGRKLYTGQQFSDTPEDVDLKMLPFTPLLALLGQMQKGPEGQWQAKERGAYAMRSLFPPLQTISRLAPNESDEFNKERQAQTLARWLGIPAYQLSETAKASEKRRQEFAS